jgi:P-type Ca2+ transporter type 2C
MSGHHPSFSTSSPYSATTSASPYVRRASHYPSRTSSPPSSTFFSLPPDHENEVQSTPDAQKHFGSSTSFRRHGSLPMTPRITSFFERIRSATADGPSGIWDRLVSLVKGVKYWGSPAENAYELVQKVEEQTPSAKYSSYAAEVRLFLSNCNPLFSP